MGTQRHPPAFPHTSSSIVNLISIFSHRHTAMSLPQLPSPPSSAFGKPFASAPFARLQKCHTQIATRRTPKQKLTRLNISSIAPSARMRTLSNISPLSWSPCWSVVSRTQYSFPPLHLFSNLTAFAGSERHLGSSLVGSQSLIRNRLHEPQ